MSRLRDTRESQALKWLTGHRVASAVDLGTAAVAGESRRHRLRYREWLGLKMGLHFAKRGFARVTKENRFEWIPPAS